LNLLNYLFAKTYRQAHRADANDRRANDNETGERQQLDNPGAQRRWIRIGRAGEEEDQAKHEPAAEREFSQLTEEVRATIHNAIWHPIGASAQD